MHAVETMKSDRAAGRAPPLVVLRAGELELVLAPEVGGSIMEPGC